MNVLQRDQKKRDKILVAQSAATHFSVLEGDSCKTNARHKLA